MKTLKIRAMLSEVEQLLPLSTHQLVG